MQYINHVISNEENKKLSKLREEAKIKKMVFELNAESSCGPDGFSGCFYQHCWDIVGPDMIKVVQTFYQCDTLPKSITHNNLVLLPKKDVIQV